MQQLTLIIAVLIFAGFGYYLMGKLDAFVKENEKGQEEQDEEKE